MTRTRKICMAAFAALCAVTLGLALSACGGKDTEPTYGYGEEGTYYYTASGDEDYMLNLWEGSFILDMGTGYAGTYEWTEGTVTFYEEGEETGSGYATEGGFSLTWEGKTYAFLRYEYYTVTFSDGGTTLSTQSVLNGKAAQDPGEPGKEGYVFLGWYADADFTERYGFNTAITGNTTIYARFIELTGTTEYKITYDFGNGETLEDETINGRIYDLPEAESSGQTFLGWWVSATNSADELTYRYEGETLCEDTTLFAVYASGSYIGASVKDDGIYWENYNAAVTDVILRDESGAEMDRFTIQSTDQEYAYDFASLPAGKYILTIQGGGVDESLTYVSNGLSRVSGFTVISGSILMYSAVENAERYYISIDCGTEGHDHSYIDNGTSLYYDFSSCEMPAEGITFTVIAYAEGYYYSVSSYNYFLGLEKTEVTVDGSLVSWTPVSYAMGYEVYIDGALVATTSDTSWSLSGYGTGTYEVSVRPVTTGYYSELSETVTFTKTTLASPGISGIDDYTITWTPVEGATGYTVSINGTETTVGGGDITSLILSGDNYTEGLDFYEISVKALAPDSANDSPYGETITVTGTSVGSAVSYENGTVTWQYSLSASEYRITVNDGDELIVTGTNSSPITLTKSGNNEITIYFVNDYGEIYGTAEITVYAYAIVFDARGGTAYMNGEAIDTIYVAKGDTVTLPTMSFDGMETEFIGWYTLPDLSGDPDADFYAGDGVAFEDGAVFTGNSTVVLYAFWVNPRTTVTLDPAGGILTDGDGNEMTETYVRINGTGYTLVVPETGDAVYAFYGWYSGENGTGTRYTDENGNALAAFASTEPVTLYARWIEVLSFSMTEYNGEDVLGVSKGPEIDLVSEVTIPETYYASGKERTVEIISGTAFSSCKNLKTINIPDTIIYMNIVNNGYDSGTGIFNGTVLENVNVYATGEPSTTREIIYYSEDGVLFWMNTTTFDVELLYYPAGRTDETYTVPETVSNENEYGYEGRNEVHVVRTVNAIGTRVFGGHDELVYMIIPENITTIGSYTFYNCTSLRYVEFAAEVTKLEDYMFRGCTSLAEFEIPDTVKEIGTYTFYNCTALKSIAIPDSVEAMGTYCFYGCSSLESVTLSSSCETINDRDFYQCTSLRAVDIPYGVTAINQYAFYGCSSLVAAMLPDSLKTIGNYAFYNCTSLESITIPDSVTSLGTYVFYGCSSLSSVELGAGLTEIGNYDFYGCYSLMTITIPEGIEYIGNYAFMNCFKLVEVINLSSLTITAGNVAYNENGGLGNYAVSIRTSLDGTSRIYDDNGYTFVFNDEEEYSLFGYFGPETDLVLPEYVNGKTYDIAQYAFYGEDRITSVSIPDTVTAIGQYAFYGCTNMESVNIPSGVTSLEAYTFYNCSSLASMEIPEGVTSLGNYCFYGCSSLKSVAIPGTCTSLGTYLFYRCSSLKSVSIPEGVTNVQTYSFYNCSALAGIVLPESLTTIGTYCFYGCISLVTITIPSKVTSIGNYSFQNCYKLVEVCNLSNRSISTGGTSFTSNGGCGNYALNVYTASSGESHLIYEDGFLFVYDDGGNHYAVGYYGDDGDVTLPSSVNGNSYVIYDYAFYLNDTLTSVSMSGVTSVSDYAFYGCGNLVALDLGESLKRIGNYAFYGCSLIKSLTLPSSLAEIGEYAFYGCSGLEHLDLGDGLTTISDYAFYGCASLKEINIPSGMTEIGAYAFYGCESITSLTIPEGVTYIGNYAFAGATLLDSISLPSSLTRLGRGVFDDSAYFNDPSKYENGAIYMGTILMRVQESFYGTFEVREGTVLIAGDAFLNCTEVKEVVLPDSVKTIDNYAFAYCSGLEKINLPAGISTIGDYGFYYCSSLESVNFACDELYIGSYAFYYCSSLGSVDFSACGAVDVGDRAFYYCTSIKEVNLEGVRSLGNYAFTSCMGLTEVSIPACIQSMGERVFYGCSNLATVYILDGATELGDYAFYACSGLKTVYIDGPLDNVGDYCFYASGVTEVIIGEGARKLGEYMFYSCKSLTSVTVPSNITEVDDHCFYNSGLVSVTLEANTTGDYMFYSCSSLESVTIGSTVENWGGYVFYNCKALTDVTLCDGLESLGEYMFYTCSAITDIVIPASITTIGRGAFSSASGLTNVYYCGTSAQWDAISIGSSNSALTGATRYYYSETEPTTDGNWWHYESGEVVVWKKQ